MHASDSATMLNAIKPKTNQGQNCVSSLWVALNLLFPALIGWPELMTFVPSTASLAKIRAGYENNAVPTADYALKAGLPLHP